MIGQVALHHRLAGEGHAGAGQVVGLSQWVGDEARLGAACAMAIAEHDDGQVVVADEAGDPVVHHGHGEEGGGALLGLHAAGGDEADERQPLGGAFQQQGAEALAVRVVYGAGLKGEVGEHQPHPVASAFGLELADAGHQAMRLHLVLQRRFYGRAESGEGHGVGGHEPLAELGEALHILVDEGPVAGAPAADLLIKQLVEQEVAVGDGQAVPEVLAPPDARRLDLAGEAPALALRPEVLRQDPLEEEADHHEEGVRLVDMHQPYPFLHGFEESRGAAVAAELLHPFGEGGLDGRRLLPLEDGRLRHLADGLLQQALDELLGHGAGCIGFPGHGDEIENHVVVERIEQDEAQAAAAEAFAHILLQNHIQDVPVLVAGLPGPVPPPFQLVPQEVFQQLAVGGNRRAAGCLGGGQRCLADGLPLQQRRVIEGGAFHDEVQLRHQAGGEEGGALLLDVGEVQQFAPLVAELLLQAGVEGALGLGQRREQRLHILYVARAQQLAAVADVAQMLNQGGEVVRGAGLPAVVEMQAGNQAELLARLLIVPLRLAEDELRQAPPFPPRLGAPLLELLPGAVQGVLVENLVRVLQPAEEGQAPFPMQPGRQLALRNLGGGQAPVLADGGALDAPP